MEANFTREGITHNKAQTMVLLRSIVLGFYACKFISFALVILFNQVFNYFDAIVSC